MFNSYSELEEYLLKIPRFQDMGSAAANFRLDEIQRFCEELGNPQSGFESIHVAGTNGKGTVCSMLASVYSSAGYNCGLFTSPHLRDVRERFRINGEMIPKDELLAFFIENQQVIKSHKLTFFELTTAIAFWWFNRKKVDISIIETGLGGRLDATNILNPLVSVITSIGLDHTEQLGNTLPEIASEKAGILKNKRWFTTGDMEKECKIVTDAYAAKIGALRVQQNVEVHQIGAEFEITSESHQVKVLPDVNSVFMGQNIRMVLQVVEQLKTKFPVESEQLADGLTHIRLKSGLAGRFEKLHPDYEWYFDGAHNPQALRGVLNYLENWQSTNGSFRGRSGREYSKKVAVVAIMQDKLTPEMCELYNRFDEVFFYEIPQPRAATFESFSKGVKKAQKIPDNREKLHSFFNMMKSELVLFTGSFYFYNTVSAWINSSSSILFHE